MQASGPIGESGGYVRRFSYDLTSGIDYQYIPLPYPIQNAIPVCEIENNFDNLIYNHSIKWANTTGFWIGFSDILQNNYKLNVSF